MRIINTLALVTGLAVCISINFSLFAQDQGQPTSNPIAPIATPQEVLKLINDKISPFSYNDIVSGVTGSFRCEKRSDGKFVIAEATKLAAGEKEPKAYTVKQSDRMAKNGADAMRSNAVYLLIVTNPINIPEAQPVGYETVMIFKTPTLAQRYTFSPDKKAYISK
jgi:hypothetical protein